MLILFFVLFGLMRHPDWVLRPKWVSEFTERAGIHWEGLSIDSQSPRILEPVIRFRWRRLTLSTRSIHADVEAGSLAISLSFRHFPPRLTEIGPMAIHAKEISISSDSSSSSSGTGVPGWIRSARMGRMIIVIDRWVIPGDSGSLDLRHGEKSEEWKLAVVENAHRVTLALRAKNPGGALEGPWSLDINGRVKEITTEFREVSFRDCRVRFEKENLQSNCPLTASLNLPHIPQIRKIRLAETFSLLLTSRLQSRDLFDSSKAVEGEVVLNLLPFDPLVNYRNLLQSWGEIKATGRGIPNQSSTHWQISSSLDLELGIKKFRRLVKILDPTDFAVPAPLHALDGEVRLSVQGKIGPDFAHAPIRLLTRLSSQDQNFDVDGSANLEVSQFTPYIQSKLQGKVLLTNLKIPLPHLDFQKLPQIFSDPRIVRSRGKQRAGTVAPLLLDYQFDIKTGERPVFILSNLTKAPVPVRLDLALETTEPLRGKVHFDSFPLDLFHRDARVDHMDIEMTGKENRISGVAEVDYTDYLIRIILSGTVEEPEVKFESEPALSDQDVISVLLFGRTSGDLEPGQSQSVGNVRSAAASRSLDLASLYLLASTPVESVGYDPESATFSAKFKLAEGTSLNVSEAQSELESIGVRKRIGSHWAITTQYGNPADPNDKSVSTLLEWSHRY